MPFTRTATQPSTNPTVTLKFAGLMTLEPSGADTCDVGIHRWAPTHTFQVVLIVNKPDRPLTVIRLRSGPLESNFMIRLDPGQADFKAYAATPGDAIERNEANARDYPLDYRWALNLREYLHSEAQRNEGAAQIVQLKTGLLYTPNLTPVILKPELISLHPTMPPAPKPLYRFAADLAVAIQRPANTKIRLEWREMGQRQELFLPRDIDVVEPRTTYTVAFLNDPGLNAPASHDEITEYYKILSVRGQPIDPDDRWRLQYAPGQRTDEIPCMPGTLEP